MAQSDEPCSPPLSKALAGHDRSRRRGCRVPGARPDAGDVDGDGFGDIAVYPGGLLGYGFSLSFLLKGPVEGSADSTDWPAPVEILNGIIQRGIGDINGDGQPELLGVWRPDPNSIQGRWMVSSTSSATEAGHRRSPRASSQSGTAAICSRRSRPRGPSSIEPERTHLITRSLS